jgi:hypothetical protein
MISSIEQLFFYICTDNRGHHREGIAIFNANQVHFNKKVGLIDQKCILEHIRKDSATTLSITTLSITHSA